MSRLTALWRRSTIIAFGLSAIAISACATGRGAFPPESAVRPARELPDRFVVEGAAGDSARPTTAPAPAGPAACRSPLVDPRDGTRLRLVRSQEGTRGDYEVPESRYGVGAGDLLRVDCTTNRGIGIVPRGR